MADVTKPEVAEVVVVEGWRDKAAVDRAVKADVVVTGGMAVSRELIGFLRKVAAERGVIILTDPDAMGERIRTRIADRVPGCKHAFIPPEEATDGSDIGIEHASPSAIDRALARVRAEVPAKVWRITWSDMMEAGLVGAPGASVRRAKVARDLGVGYGNAKSFWKRLNVLGVDPEEFRAAVRAAGGGRSHD
ncbi:primase/topoisomerase like protein [Kyrpidia tusciae DSM 2912]|uniref:Ribonuclease M5 n=1 Tax=Kyrpidia tusciae (strain DSM 2912 / NBRC 15312 / T2) TaxID=562970 RepID=D5WRH0_KYRT2|nr:primase/topoisomerase like protein [Kyrpidia tusciae DSM 2912]